MENNLLVVYKKRKGGFVMMNIIIKNKTDNYVSGTYFGQSYKINFQTKQDEFEVLTNEESQEVLNSLVEQSKENIMLLIKLGSIVRVQEEEGHVISEYDLKIESIEEELNDEEGTYFCTAYGSGVTEEDEELADDFTHMVTYMNLLKIIA